MKESVKRKWIAALEGGRYSQGRGYLKRRSPIGHRIVHCCLGVLAETQGLNVEDTNNGREGLSNKYRRIFGISKNQHEILMALNDTGMSDPRTMKDCNVRHTDKPWTFRQIARYIRKYL